MFFKFNWFNKRRYRELPSDLAKVKAEVQQVKQKLSGEEASQSQEKTFDGFRMVVDFDSEKSEKYFNEPTAEMVYEVLDQMSNELVNFVIVEHSKSVGGCVFIQCMWGGDGVYQVEAQVRRQTQNGVLRNQYREFMEDKSAVKGLFRDFLNGQAPNIKGWEHMEELDFYED